MTGPLIALVWRQHLRLRRQDQIIAAQREQLRVLGETVGRIRSDVELLSAAIPPARRATALALVRDRHRIESAEGAEAWQ